MYNYEVIHEIYICKTNYYQLIFIEMIKKVSKKLNINTKCLNDWKLYIKITF